MALIRSANDFDNLLIQTIEETVKYCLGEANTNIIRNYLEARGLPMTEIPNKPEQFSEELRNIVGFGRRQILCPASILEETILEVLCKKLGIELCCERPPNFSHEVRKLREACLAEVAGGERA